MVHKSEPFNALWGIGRILSASGKKSETKGRAAAHICSRTTALTHWVCCTPAPEADVFAAYLRSRHGLAPDALERLSTNCGNNVTYLLRLMGERGWPADRLILAQDATMQRRMHAIMRKEAPCAEVAIFATYAVRVVPRPDGGRPAAPSGLDDALAFAEEPLGMWDVERYVALLLGEIPRLRDDEGGYGPRGRGFLAHVDVPDEVLAAWGRLSAAFPDLVRPANPAFAAPRGAR